MLSGCGNQKQLDNKQTNCDHIWTDIKWDVFAGVHRIYCPKCKLEKSVSNEEWNKIKADMEYEMEDIK